MKTIYTLLLSLSFVFVNAQASEQTLEEFKSEDWKVVKMAKLTIESQQAEAIPELIKLLDSDKKVKLSNTGSLIYPGAEKFFGHGQILNYDIDYIAIRAGWLIEEISFNNFGFSGIHLPKDELITHVKITFPDYYNNSSNRKKIESSTDAELRVLAQKLSVDAVKDWWKAEGKDWSRLNALVDALKSFDEKRQVRVLFYMRNSESHCDGLTKEFYYEEISKEIVRLSGSDVQRISEHAKLILLDSKLEWLEMKAQ